MPLNEKKKTGYHEAGHCIEALDTVEAAVTSCQIEGDGDDWEGTSGIDVDQIPAGSRIDVALAGIVAEAKALGISHGTPGMLNREALELFEEIADVVTMKFYAELGNDVWPVQLDVDGVARSANLSRKDIENIPPGSRTEDQVIGTLAQLCDTFNDNGTWSRVDALAKAVIGAAPAPVGAFQLFLMETGAEEND